jgi:hypothetical protein
MPGSRESARPDTSCSSARPASSGSTTCTRTPARSTPSPILVEILVRLASFVLLPVVFLDAKLYISCSLLIF